MYHFKDIFLPNSITFKNLDYLRSGYGTSFDSDKKNEQSIYITDFDFKNKKAADSDLLSIVSRSLKDLDPQKNFVLINDGSAQYIFLTETLVEAGINYESVDINTSLNEDKNFDDVFFKQFGLDQIDLYFAARVSKLSQKPVILPKSFIRIINASFSQSQQKSVWPNYSVYVENERYHQFDLFCKKMNLKVLWNIFKISPNIYLNYFTNDLIIEMNAPGFKNNFLYEQQIFSNYARGNTEIFYASEVKKHFDLHRHLFKKFQQAAFPVDLFSVKYLDHTVDVNHFFRGVYE